jgi:microcystin-dependent protein
MVDTTTPNYGWVQPAVGGDASTWGTTINNDLALIDAQVWQNEQGVAPVGAVVMFAGGVIPVNWLLCNGASLATTGIYAKLFAVLQYAFGGSGANFNLPNLVARFPFGASVGDPLGQVAGDTSVTLAAANLPSHTHTITQVAHSHTASQPTHVHADAGHAHSITDQVHAHGSNLVKQGAGAAGLYPGGGFPIAGAGNTDGAATGITGTNAAAANIQAAGDDAVTVYPTTPLGPTATGSVGSGTPFSIIPVFVAINFIIRFQ